MPRSDERNVRGGQHDATYLLIVGDRVPLAWILRHERMAFPDFARWETKALKPGDRLLLYTTRGCFRNPQRDYGRVIGEAIVASPVTAFDAPVVICDRAFPVGCEITLQRLALVFEGVILRDLVADLDTFPSKDAWTIRLRRPLVRLSEHDAELLSARLKPLTLNPTDSIEGYLRWLHGPPRGATRASRG